ncbi:MAG TPA: GNAT family N-acetyltransferase [Euzebya sp.]|nr:GNAT family N-acetyltransferase [Euzebya sp.]
MDPTGVIGPADGPGGSRRRRGGRAPKEVQEVALRDGSRVWVRPIRSEDRAMLEQGLQWLSPQSRYMRFHTHVDRLTRAQLDYLVDVDHMDHEALVALDPDLRDQPGVAVARYIRLTEEPHVAEAAITVIDSHQGRGIGTALIGLLEQLAHQRGITTFRNYVLAENTAMLQIFRELDGEVLRESAGLYRVDVPVPGPEQGQPDTPAGRWVTSIGRHSSDRREAWAYPVVWFMRLLGGSDREPQREGESRLLKGWAARPDTTDDDDDQSPPAPDPEDEPDADPEGPAS